jgi:hypothetical protein
MHKVKIGGHEFTAVGHDEAEKCDVVVCLRVSDKPIPEQVSKIERCALCHARIWVSATSPKKPPRWCLQCTTLKAEELDRR